MSELLTVSRVSKNFGGLNAVHDVSLKIEPGETVGMIGPNGAGKTTLFAIISGFIKPDRGRILFKQEPIEQLPPYQICRIGLTRTFQIVQSFPELTALENVMVGALSRLARVPKARKKSFSVLELLGMEDKAMVLAKSLTLAERKRLEIARALATEPSLILVDECLAGLTPTEVSQIVSTLKKVKSQGITLFLIEHVMQVIMSLSDRVIVLDHGVKITEGPPADVVRDPRVIASYLGEDTEIA